MNFSDLKVFGLLYAIISLANGGPLPVADYDTYDDELDTLNPPHTQPAVQSRGLMDTFGKLKHYFTGHPASVSAVSLCQ